MGGGWAGEGGWRVRVGPRAPTLSPVVHIEFTIEPFVEGQPGTHVLAALDAARDLGVTVAMGPFGSSCDVVLGDAGRLVGAVTDAALLNGASHVSIHLERER